MRLGLLAGVLAWRWILRIPKQRASKVLAGTLCPLVPLQLFSLPRAEPTLDEHPAGQVGKLLFFTKRIAGVWSW